MAVQHVDAEAAAQQSAVQVVPRLESGDHLTRAEFERRYEAMPELKKAELIEGVVYVGSPVRHAVHSFPHAVVMTWLGAYVLNTPGIDYGDNGTVRLDLDNEPQPDAYVRIREQAGGHSRIREDYVEGAPELVVEIAASSASIDLHVKRRAYRRNGVQEYLVWRPEERRVDWFSLQDGEYAPLPTDDRGAIASRVFPGLQLLVTALLEGDHQAVLAEQLAALGTPEHRQFVDQLAAQRASS
jgi:Uma2 family endonuclease